MGNTVRALTKVDRVLSAVQVFLNGKTAISAARPMPASNTVDAVELSKEEERHAAGLMRVNHVGEVCAQALYESQALFARTPDVYHFLKRSSQEEADHLVWTSERVHQLDSHLSYLNFLWFGGAFAIGASVALMGDRASLGFMAETERQVSAHLQSHLDLLPLQDESSRAIVAQMKRDEDLHAHNAQTLGAREVPFLGRLAMRAMAKVMTTVAYHV